MNIHSSAAVLIERLRQETGSDFVALGLIDHGKRKLSWTYATGSVSERTLLVEQKLTAGLSGAALRSGRAAIIQGPLSESERYRLGEPLLLNEQLQIAAALPIEAERGQFFGVLLIGRRAAQTFQAEQLKKVGPIILQLALELKPSDKSTEGNVIAK